MKVFKDCGIEWLNWTELMESGALIYGTMIGRKYTKSKFCHSMFPIKYGCMRIKEEKYGLLYRP